MSPRRVIDSFGRKGRRGYVRVFQEEVGGRSLVRVQWREGKGIRTESTKYSRNAVKEALEYAEEMHDKLVQKTAAIEPVTNLTIRELFIRHVTANEQDWRPRTLEIKRYRWRKFELFASANSMAASVTREQMDGFKQAMLANKHSANQVRMCIDNVLAVFRWGVERDVLAPTKLTAYKMKMSRDARRQVVKMAEYRANETEKLMAELDPKEVRQWRIWVLLVVFAHCGARQNAARHLSWDDIDFEQRAIRWRGELDKMGTDRVQPMTDDVFDAFWVAYGWRLHDRYTGPYVFFGAQATTRGIVRQRKAWEKAPKKVRVVVDKPWSYQAFNQALHNAEGRADVPNIKYRAAHGFRRGVVGDLIDKYGSEKLAAEWIGDKDVRVVKDSYVMEREDRMRKVAEGMNSNAIKRNEPAEDGEPSGVKP
jgi:integrase